MKSSLDELKPLRNDIKHEMDPDKATCVKPSVLTFNPTTKVREKLHDEVISGISKVPPSAAF